MSKIIKILDVEGAIRYVIEPNSFTGELPTWNEIFSRLAEESGRSIENLDFSSAIREQVSLQRLMFRKCELAFEDMERSSIIDCDFEQVSISQSSFHHVADSASKADRGMGTLFKNCTFKHVTFRKCDLVLCKFFNCSFDGCTLQDCDMRNVYWFDKFTVTAGCWQDIPDMGDPFASSRLVNVKFGHPVGNLMNLPVQMMIPASYKSIWDHLGGVQRRLTRISYMMNEGSGDLFHSSI